MSLPGTVVRAAVEETVEILSTLDPATLEVEVGTTVTWRNSDSERYRVRSEDGPVRFDSGNLASGESFTFTFASEGSYPYYDHRNRDDTSYLGMIIVGGASTAADGPLPDTGTVSIIDKSFQPGSFAITTGGTIEWNNDDGEAHTVTATDSTFDSGILGSGATFSQTFAEPGSYAYFCLIHLDMRGTITVSDPVAGPDGSEPAPATVAPDPLTETVPPPDLGSTLGPLEASTTASIVDRSFQPQAIEVVAGEAVTWSNDDREGHTVTAVDGSFNSGVMTVGGEYSNTFETVGTFDYFCAIHPEMTGTVTVTEPPQGSPSP